MATNQSEKPVANSTQSIISENKSVQHGLQSERILKEKIAAGEWETLPLLPAFQQRSPEGQVIAFDQAVDSRITQLKRMLPTLLNMSQRAAYIQILDRIHELESRKTEIINQFFARSGQRKISSESEGKNYY